MLPFNSTLDEGLWAYNRFKTFPWRNKHRPMLWIETKSSHDPLNASRGLSKNVLLLQTIWMFECISNLANHACKRRKTKSCAIETRILALTLIYLLLFFLFWLLIFLAQIYSLIYVLVYACSVRCGLNCFNFAGKSTVTLKLDLCEASAEKKTNKLVIMYSKSYHIM